MWSIPHQFYWKSFPLSQHHLKKLEGRRLDFDYKKKRQGKIPDEEVRQALEKFHESKEVAEISMYNLLETDVRIYHLTAWCFIQCVFVLLCVLGIVLILLAALNNSVFFCNTLPYWFYTNSTFSFLRNFGKDCHFRISKIEDENFLSYFNSSPSVGSRKVGNPVKL